MKEKKLTGYPSIDKPWLKYYSEQHIKAEIPRMTAYEYLKKMNRNRLDFQAIDSSLGNYTYGELFNIIDTTSASLYCLGIKKEKIVLAMLPVMPHEHFLFYAIDAVGAAIAPLSPLYPTDEVCKSILKFDAELFFTSDDVLTPEMEKAVYENTNVSHIVNISFTTLQERDSRTISWTDFLALGQNVQLPEIHRNPDDLLFLANTGGTTGEPKSVMLNDNCFNMAVHQYLNCDLDYQAGDRWMRLWPIFSASAAVANFHLPLCAGMDNLLRCFPMDMSDFDKMVLEEYPAHLILIPQLLDVLEKSKLLENQDMSYIKTVGCGGLGLTKQFEERINVFFEKHNIHTFLGYGWGLTENAACGATRTNMNTCIFGTAGAPMVKTIVSVFDTEEETELSYDEEGELCIYSPTMMMGYYNDPEMTSKVLRKHADGSVWLHTGDLGMISENGIVTVNGRATRVIFVFPTAKIYPQAMESAISKVRGVREVAICETPDAEHEGFFRPICFIVPSGECNDTETRDNVKTFCEDTFPEYSVPRQIYIRDHLPLTKVGKIDYRTLEEQLTTS